MREMDLKQIVFTIVIHEEKRGLNSLINCPSKDGTTTRTFTHIVIIVYMH